MSGLCLALTVYPEQPSASWPRWWGCGRVLVATWPARPGVEGRWPQPGGVWGWVRGGGTGYWCGGRVADHGETTVRPRWDHGGNLTSPNGPQPAQPAAWTPARTTPVSRRHFLSHQSTKPNWNATPGRWNIHEPEGTFGGRRGEGGEPTNPPTHHICPNYKLFTTTGFSLWMKYRAGSRVSVNILASVWEERRGEERLVLRLARWDDVIGGLEVTGVTYPGVPPHSKPHTATQSNPNHGPPCILPASRPSSAKHEEKKSCGWKMQTEWALNHKRQKVWQKAEIWQQNLEYQEYNPGHHQSLPRSVFWGWRRGKTAMIPYLWWRSICSEYKWGIKWKSWFN